MLDTRGGANKSDCNSRSTREDEAETFGLRATEIEPNNVLNVSTCGQNELFEVRKSFHAGERRAF